MKNSLIVCVSMLCAALYGTTAHAQVTGIDPAYDCATACENELGPSCHDRRTVVGCLERQPACAGDHEVINAAGMILFGRMQCPAEVEPTRRTRHARTTRRTTTTTTVTTAPTTGTVTTTTPPPRTDPTGLTYVIPNTPIIGDGPAVDDEIARRSQQLCVEVGGTWYAEGRTAQPSRGRFVALIEHLLVAPNTGPSDDASDDQRPGVCLTPEGAVLIDILRQEINQRREGDAALSARIDGLQGQINDLNAQRERIDMLQNEIALLREQLAARPAPDAGVSDDSRVRELERRMAEQEARYREALTELRNTIEAYRQARADLDRARDAAATTQPVTAGEDTTPRSYPQRVRRITGERLGFIAEGAFEVSRYQLVAHMGSHSPKFFGIGAGLTIRLVDHLYLAGVTDIGVGLRDGEHVRRRFDAHYRVGMLGVVADHLLLGAAYSIHHSYSGNGALMEQNGTWYQYRFRGLELEAGYLWRERGWSPFVSVQLGLGQGSHAERRLNNDSPDGVINRFDPFFGIRVGVMNLRRPSSRRP
ncbi:MAG: hypothetical protein U0487_01280 [Patescibacteria group bacterium]